MMAGHSSGPPVKQWCKWKQTALNFVSRPAVAVLKQGRHDFETFVFVLVSCGWAAMFVHSYVTVSILFNHRI